VTKLGGARCRAASGSFPAEWFGCEVCDKSYQWITQTGGKGGRIGGAF